MAPNLPNLSKPPVVPTEATPASGVQMASSLKWILGAVGVIAVLSAILVMVFTGDSNDVDVPIGGSNSGGSGDSGSDSCSQNAADGIHFKQLNSAIALGTERKTYVESWHLTSNDVMYLKTIVVSKAIFGDGYEMAYIMEKVVDDDELSTSYSEDGSCFKTDRFPAAQNSRVNTFISQGVLVFTEEPRYGYEESTEIYPFEKTSSTNTINGFSCDVYESSGKTICLAEDICAVVSNSDPGTATLEVLEFKTGSLSASNFPIASSDECTDTFNPEDSSNVKHDLDVLFPEADQVLENAKAYL